MQWSLTCNGTRRLRDVGEILRPYESLVTNQSRSEALKRVVRVDLYAHHSLYTGDGYDKRDEGQQEIVGEAPVAWGAGRIGKVDVERESAGRPMSKCPSICVGATVGTL